MTDEERKDEAAEEPVEDLETPGGEQDDVAGGKCHKPTVARCDPPTCKATMMDCTMKSRDVVVYNQ